MECKQQAKYKVQTYDGQTIYLCEEHIKSWHAPKIIKIK
jgi:YHS domain-containing protein